MIRYRDALQPTQRNGCTPFKRAHGPGGRKPHKCPQIRFLAESPSLAFRGRSGRQWISPGRAGGWPT